MAIEKVDKSCRSHVHLFIFPVGDAVHYRPSSISVGILGTIVMAVNVVDIPFETILCRDFAFEVNMHCFIADHGIDYLYKYVDPVIFLIKTSAALVFEIKSLKASVDW